MAYTDFISKCDKTVTNTFVAIILSHGIMHFMNDIPSRVFMSNRKIILEDGIYHITQRAPGRELVFLENADYLTFISILKQVSKRFNLSIFCFSLLSNHLHILTQIKRRNLPQAMQELFKRYAQIFNIKYQRKGHVFCGRYRAALCNDDRYFLIISLYIHLNAYRAGMIDSPFKYKWHSLDVYIKKIRSSFVNPKLILDGIFANDTVKAKEIYKNLIKGVSGIKTDDFMEEKNTFKKLYDDFVKWIRINSKKDTIYKDSPIIKSFLDIESEIKKFKNKKTVSSPQDKKAIIYLIQQLISRGYNKEEIAEKLHLNRATIYRLLKQSENRL